MFPACEVGGFLLATGGDPMEGAENRNGAGVLRCCAPLSRTHGAHPKIADAGWQGVPAERVGDAIVEGYHRAGAALSSQSPAFGGSPEVPSFRSNRT